MAILSGNVLLRFEVEGEAQFRTLLHGMEGKVADLTPAFDAIETDFRKYMVEVFESEGGAQASGRWQSLSTKKHGKRPSYAEWKASHYPGRKILQREGDLKASLTSDLTVEKGPQGMVLSSDVPYAMYHQSRRPRGRLPRRPIINLTDAVKRRWARLLHDRVRWEG